MEVKADKLWFIHKLHTSLSYGGPEEGGWWYDHETPIDPSDHDYMKPRIFTDEEEAFAACRELNAGERARRDEEGANYTSVLSYKWIFYTYDVTNDQEPQEPHRPHYE